MILVLLGTFPLQFQRPLIELEKLLKDGIISDKVIVQNGHTKFESKFMTFRPFMSLEELLSYYAEADLIITQGGTGSILKGFKANKKIIAIARLAKNEESVDDHQLELVNEFESRNYLIGWHEGDKLQDLIHKAENFKPVPYKSSNESIVNYLIEYIDSI